jgi:hypothetical protein
VLSHPTHDRLVALGLVGMAKAFEEQRAQPAVASLTFEERLGLLEVCDLSLTVRIGLAAGDIPTLRLYRQRAPAPPPSKTARR